MFPGTVSAASFVLALTLSLNGEKTSILLVAGRLASFQVQLASASWPGLPTTTLDFSQTCLGRVRQQTSST